jgi:hypothetical protein
MCWNGAEPQGNNSPEQFGEFSGKRVVAGLEMKRIVKQLPGKLFIRNDWPFEI